MYVYLYSVVSIPTYYLVLTYTHYYIVYMHTSYIICYNNHIGFYYYSIYI